MRCVVTSYSTTPTVVPVRLLVFPLSTYTLTPWPSIHRSDRDSSALLASIFVQRVVGLLLVTSTPYSKKTRHWLSRMAWPMRGLLYILLGPALHGAWEAINRSRQIGWTKSPCTISHLRKFASCPLPRSSQIQAKERVSVANLYSATTMGYRVCLLGQNRAYESDTFNPCHYSSEHRYVSIQKENHGFNIEGMLR